MTDRSGSTNFFFFFCISISWKFEEVKLRVSLKSKESYEKGRAGEKFYHYLTKCYSINSFPLIYKQIFKVVISSWIQHSNSYLPHPSISYSFLGRKRNWRFLLCVKEALFVFSLGAYWIFFIGMWTEQHQV